MTNPKPKVKAIRAWAVVNLYLGSWTTIERTRKEAEKQASKNLVHCEVIPVLITPLTPKKKR